MLFAKKDGNIIEAVPNEEAFCPHCEQEVISKCGNIKIWHWAHKAIECVYSTEPETIWHLRWKRLAQEYGCEVEKRFGNFIADVYIPDKKIIEFQHSTINTTEILERCQYYNNRGWQINWVFDYQEKDIKNHLRFRIVEGLSEEIKKLKQKWAKKSINVLFSELGYPVFGHVYIDGGSWLFDIKKLYENGNGWGKNIKPIKIFGIEYFNNQLIGESIIFSEAPNRSRAAGYIDKNKELRNIGLRGEMYDI